MSTTLLTYPVRIYVFILYTPNLGFVIAVFVFGTGPGHSASCAVKRQHSEVNKRRMHGATDSILTFTKDIGRSRSYPCYYVGGSESLERINAYERDKM